MTALPLSGHKHQELLLISTEDFDITIKGVPQNKIVEAFHLHRNEHGNPIRSKFQITPSDCSVKIYNPLSLEGLVEYEGGGIYPCFFEQTNYELILEKRDTCAKEIIIDHANKEIRDAITPTGKQGRILSGIINFYNEVGPSQFKVLSGQHCLLSFEIEVFPSKLDYVKDFWQLLQEVNEEVYNLAFDFLMKTSFSASLISDDKPTGAEFFYILNAIFKELIKSLNIILKQPHHKIIPINRVVSPEKVKKADAKSIRWLVNRSHLMIEHGTGITIGNKTYIPRRVLDSKKELTYDTFENRFLKWMLSQLDLKLKHFAQRYSEVNRHNLDNKVTDKIYQMRKHLSRMTNSTFLKEVGYLARLDHSSLVMQMAPGYKDVFKYYLMLLKGLHIQSDLFHLSLKNLAELYEYWCFLKLNKLLRQKYHLQSNNLVKTERNGITVNLAKGKESKLTYIDKRNGEQFNIYYNRFYTNLPTVAQQPDNILELRKTGTHVNYNYIFDAKYRLRVDDAYIQKYGQAGPPEDTINAMHRYRDAIVMQSNNQLSRNIFGAYILFPHNNEAAFAGREKGKPASKLYKSIEEVGIGALPFLPSQVTLVEELISDLILESPQIPFERTITQEGFANYLDEEKNIRNVLIGPLGRKEQLPLCLQKNMYYTYLDKVKSFLGALEYVAIYQSKEKFKDEAEQGILYYGKIRDFEIMKRSQIKEAGSPRRGEELAVVFYVESWQRKTPKIATGGYGPAEPQRTSWSIFQQARVYPELHLNALEIKLWRELKRYRDCSFIKFPNPSIGSMDKLEMLEFPGLTIIRNGPTTFTVNIMDKSKVFDFASIERRPGSILKQIIRFWKEQIAL